MNSLLKKISVSFIAIVSFMLISSQVITYFQTKSLMREEVQKSAEMTVGLVTDNISTIMKNIEKDISNIAEGSSALTYI